MRKTVITKETGHETGQLLENRMNLLQTPAAVMQGVIVHGFQTDSSQINKNFILEKRYKNILYKVYSNCVNVKKKLEFLR